MIRKLLNKFGLTQFLRDYLRKKKISSERALEEAAVVNSLSYDKFSPLTIEEKRKVHELWGSISSDLHGLSYKEFEMFKNVYGFDERFLTHNLYLPIVARLLNDFRYTKIFDNKGLLGYITKSRVRFPYCYVRRIGSDFYDNEMHQISFEDAIEICSKENELFIKPSSETSGGKGAQLLKLDNLSTEERRKLITEELTSRTNEYVVQECIHQHPIMAQFNPSSVNTFRITTLMLNGKFSVCSVVLRCGKAGSKIDNWGAGGLMVYVSQDGKVNPIAHDISLNEYRENGSCKFGECKIPQMPDILKKIEQCHTQNFAICKFIGWDIAINHDGEPIVIELNSSQPGVIGEQIVSGPIFGDRTQEVIDYCKSKKFSY